MRNTPRFAVRPRANDYAAWKNNHLWLHFRFGEGTGTTTSDKSGRVVNTTINGTTTGIWTNPALGIKPNSAGTYLWLLDADVPGIDAFYDCTDLLADQIFYIEFAASIAGTPTSDTANYIMSMGRRDETGTNDWGTFAWRINQNLQPTFQLQRRGTSNQNTLRSAGTGGAMPADGTMHSYAMMLEDDGTVSWYKDGTLTASASVTLSEGPLADTASGIAIMGRHTTSSPWTPTGMPMAAGSVAPYVKRIHIGRCAKSAANRALLERLFVDMAATGNLPRYFGDITS